MKQYFSAFLLVVLMSMAALNASAQDFEVDGIYYDYDDEASGSSVSVAMSTFDAYQGDVVIPEKVTYDGQTYNVTGIGYGAFSSCSGLTSVTIPSSVTSIGYEAFADCSGLTSIVVDDGNSAYDSRNNCNAIIETESNTLIAGCKNTVIPNSVTSIFVAAFYGCSGLTSVTIPEGVTSIGSAAFSGCSGLTSVTIPSSVTSIGDMAFEDCSSLTSVTVNWNEPIAIGRHCFSNAANATLYVPAGTRALYLYYGSDTGWNVFKEIVESVYDFITISSAGEGTYCSDHDLDFSGVQGLKAYIASGFIKQTGTVMLMRVTDVPAQTGLMVKGTPGTYKVPYAESTAYYVNMLKGNVEPVSVEPTEGVYTNYYLSNGSDGLGFYQIKSTRTMSANRAILQIPTSVVNGARRVNIVFDDDEATGINDASRTNGQKAEKYFNMNGQRIATPKKGLYIKDGKKIIY